MLAEFKHPPTPAELAELVRQSRPALIHGLFDADPIRRIHTVEAARAAIGRMTFQVQRCDEELGERLALDVRGGLGRASTIELADYLDWRPGQPVTRCFAQATPPPLRELARFADFSPDPSDTTSLLFIARAGQSSHLHFDDDQRDVLLYQVFGRKRFVLIHPRETFKTTPFVSPLGFTTGGIYIENMTPDDRAAYLRWTHAVEVTLEPGTTLFIPRMYWHYADYDEMAMSVTFRLGRTEIVRRFAEGTPAPGVTVQALAMELADHERCVSGDRRALVAELRAVLDAAPERRTFGIAQEHAFEPVAARWLARPPKAEHAEHLCYANRPATLARAKRRVPTEWSVDDRPAFADGLTLVTAHRRPAVDSPFLLVRHRQVVAELRFPEPWAHSVLARIAGANGSVTVGELADQATPIDLVVELLGELGERGWLLSV